MIYKIKFLSNVSISEGSIEKTTHEQIYTDKDIEQMTFANPQPRWRTTGMRAIISITEYNVDPDGNMIPKSGKPAPVSIWDKFYPGHGENMMNKSKAENYDYKSENEKLKAELEALKGEKPEPTTEPTSETEPRKRGTKQQPK